MSETQNGGNVMGNVNCLRCRFRHEDNGNCTAVGGFCTAVPAAHCPLLREYLDTELTPEAFQSFVGFFQDLIGNQKASEALDRFRQLVKADRTGRLVVPPCKVGDTVYWVHGAVITECKVHRIQKNRNGLYICLKSNVSHGAFRTDLFFGKSICLTCEEAKKALEAMKDE